VAAKGRNLIQPSARGIGFVFQDLALWPHMTVAESLDFILASASMPKRERKKRISESLRLARVEPFASSYPGQLSGGEQQRAAIARALVTFPRLLLLDEPTSNLDFDLKLELRNELAALQRLLNITTIYVSHDRDEATELSHRVIVMRDGRVTQQYKTELVPATPSVEP
jgi:ABC-type Fe3+/spermidine/putrescine transport system ATPase subunit